MACSSFKTKDGLTVILCGTPARRRCHFCDNWADRACDFPFIGPKEGETCDKALCSRCASRPFSDTDVCPPHARYLGSLSEESQSKFIAAMKVAAEKRAIETMRSSRSKVSVFSSRRGRYEVSLRRDDRDLLFGNDQDVESSSLARIIYADTSALAISSLADRCFMIHVKPVDLKQLPARNPQILMP